MHCRKQYAFLPFIIGFFNRICGRSVGIFKFLVLIVLCLIVLLQPVCAEETDYSDEIDDEAAAVTNGPVNPDIKVPGMGGVNVTHAYLSSKLEGISRKIDSFFGADRIYVEASGTYIQAKSSLIYGRGGDFDTENKFRVKVDLPQLKEKVNLVIESDDQDSLDVDNGGDLTDSSANSDTSVALQFMMKEREKWVLTLRPGLRLSNPIKTFIKLRFRRSQPLTEKWLSRGTVEVGYYSDRGWENEWRLDLERAIGATDYFRSSSKLLWREEVPGNQLLIETFYLAHRIDRRQLLAFEIGTTAETRPNLRDLSYFSSLSYRRNIHNGWLFFEFKPQVIYARENDFKADPALVLTLEALLGGRYLN